MMPSLGLRSSGLVGRRPKYNIVIRKDLSISAEVRNKRRVGGDA